MSYLGRRPVDKIFKSNARINSIDTNTCILSTKEWGNICKGDGTANEFRDSLSNREFQQSGICQVCQDDIVKQAEEAEALEEEECPYVQHDLAEIAEEIESARDSLS